MSAKEMPTLIERAGMEVSSCIDFMMHFTPLEHFEKHSEEHGELIADLNGRDIHIPRRMKSDAEEIANVRLFGKKFQFHADTTDVEMMKYYSP